MSNTYTIEYICPNCSHHNSPKRPIEANTLQRREASDEPNQPNIDNDTPKVIPSVRDARRRPKKGAVDSDDDAAVSTSPSTKKTQEIGQFE